MSVKGAGNRNRATATRTAGKKAVMLLKTTESPAKASFWPAADSPRSGMPTMFGFTRMLAAVVAAATAGNAKIGSATVRSRGVASVKPGTSAASETSQRSAENMDTKMKACVTSGASMPLAMLSLLRVRKAL